MARPEPALSVVVPMFHEASVLPLLVKRLRGVLDGLGEAYEVLAVAVDDGPAARQTTLRAEVPDGDVVELADSLR